jgi:hypothetical protein
LEHDYQQAGPRKNSVGFACLRLRRDRPRGRPGTAGAWERLVTEGPERKESCRPDDQALACGLDDRGCHPIHPVDHHHAANLGEQPVQHAESSFGDSDEHGEDQPARPDIPAWCGSRAASSLTRGS